MATASTKSNPPVILSGSHGDGSNLTSVTPLAQEGHDKGLNPSRAKQKRAEVGYSLEDARRTTTGFPNRGLRRRSGRRHQAVAGSRPSAIAVKTHLESVSRHGITSLAAHLLFLFSKLLLNLVHLSRNTLVGVHLETLPHQLGSKDKEENGSEETGQALRDQGGNSMA